MSDSQQLCEKRERERAHLDKPRPLHLTLDGNLRQLEVIPLIRLVEGEVEELNGIWNSRVEHGLEELRLRPVEGNAREKVLNEGGRELPQDFPNLTAPVLRVLNKLKLVCLDAQRVQTRKLREKRLEILNERRVPVAVNIQRLEILKSNQLVERCSDTDVAQFQMRQVKRVDDGDGDVALLSSFGRIAGKVELEAVQLEL